MSEPKDNVDVEELVWALQRNPNTALCAYRMLGSQTTTGWEKLGRLLFRRSLHGDVVGWVREDEADANRCSMGWYNYQRRETTQWAQSPERVLRKEVDARLLRLEMCLTDHRSTHPATETLVAAAAGLARADQFTLRSLTTQVDSQRRVSSRPLSSQYVGRMYAEARRTGTSTQIAVAALTGCLNGQDVVIVAGDGSTARESVRHCLQGIIQRMGCQERLGHLVHWNVVVETPIPGGSIKIQPISTVMRSWDHQRYRDPDREETIYLFEHDG